MAETPLVDEYVRRHLLELQAPLKQSTMFGPAGRWVRRRTGERIVLAPNGAKIRVVSYIDGGSAVEHGNDHRHAVARPAPHVIKLQQ